MCRSIYYKPKNLHLVLYIEKKIKETQVHLNQETDPSYLWARAVSQKNPAEQRQGRHDTTSTRNMK